MQFAASDIKCWTQFHLSIWLSEAEIWHDTDRSTDGTVQLVFLSGAETYGEPVCDFNTAESVCNVCLNEWMLSRYTHYIYRPK